MRASGRSLAREVPHRLQDVQHPERREFVRITEDVQDAVDEAGVGEGMVLVSAMHITAGVWVNDDEPGIQADALEWLDKLAPPSWKEPANDVARELLPDPGDYRHHRGGEDNGDAHLKNLLVHHQVSCRSPRAASTSARGRRSSTASSTAAATKRLVIKVLGRMKRAAALALVLVALALAACGVDNDKKSASTPATTPTSPAPAATTETTELARNPGEPGGGDDRRGAGDPVGDRLPAGRARPHHRAKPRPRSAAPAARRQAERQGRRQRRRSSPTARAGCSGWPSTPTSSSNSFVYLYRTTERGTRLAR